MYVQGFFVKYHFPVRQIPDDLLLDIYIKKTCDFVPNLSPMIFFRYNPYIFSIFDPNFLTLLFIYHKNNLCLANLAIFSRIWYIFNVSLEKVALRHDLFFILIQYWYTNFTFVIFIFRFISRYAVPTRTVTENPAYVRLLIDFFVLWFIWWWQWHIFAF